MTRPEFDPREVLERYVAVLREPGGSVVRDASELAHPKEAIRIVLQHCIKTATDGESREFLRNAYVSLSNLAAEGTKLFGKQARQITHVAAPLQSLLDRVTAEIAVLTQELKTLPGAE
jgi:hypothetical protein